MLRRQLHLLVVLSLVLIALLGVIAFGPEPTAQEPTAEELAEWTIPLGGELRIVGDPTVDWYILEGIGVIPLDPGDPYSPLLLIPTEDECWMPKADEGLNTI